MRFYLNGESEKNVGYVPDWLKVSFEEDGKDLELTLDIRGEIDYTPNNLDCRVKGSADPWVLYDYNSGDEIDLSELDENQVDQMFPPSKIAELLKTGKDIRVGIYPEGPNAKLAEEDNVVNCKGHFEICDEDGEYEVDLDDIEAELNL